MATSEVEEGRVLEVAEFLREKIRTEYAGDKEIDARDFDRIRTDPLYCFRFAKQRLNGGGDENDCLKMLVTALHFRTSYGVNDITFQDINKEVVQSGVCYPRGQDKEGSDIVYLLIRMHRKEKERGEQLKRFALYFLEKHDRYFPKRRMSLFMDCSEAGYSNMDLDLVKFIISLFKQFYPMKLGSIYVHEMPWVMNAGWSIIKTWLSPAARNKMRFVNKDSVLQHFNREHLSIRHGGTDSWQFSYPPKGGLESEGLERILPLLQNERGNEGAIRDLVMEMVDRHANAKRSLIPEMKEEVTEVSMSDIPKPANQSKDKNLDTNISSDVTIISSDVTNISSDVTIISSDVTNISSDVTNNRLEGKEEESGVSAKKVHFGQIKETSIISTNKPATSRGIMKQVSQTEIIMSSLPHIGNLLDVCPQSELVFHSRDLTPSCTLSLTNLSPSLVSFKIKTTSPGRFKVQPSMGVIASKERDAVSISCQAEDLSTITDDKFLVQSTNLHPDSRTGQTELNYHWKTVSQQLILENRLKCKVVDTLSEIPSSKGDAMEFSIPQPRAVEKQQSTNKELPILLEAVRTLCHKVERIQSGIKSIYTLVIVMAIANVLLLLIVLMT